MGLMGFIAKGSRVTITFEADATNGNSTGLLAGFIPSTIDPLLDFIPPGLTGKLEIAAIPDDAKRLKIEIDTPEPIGKGILTVTENDIIKNTRTLLDDSEWVYIIH